MKRILGGLFLLFLSAMPLVAQEKTKTMLTIPVDSSAFLFSPGNWTGDQGRAGKEFRQTWNSGAYFSIIWECPDKKPEAKLLFDTSGYTKSFPAPKIAYCIDGEWSINVPCQAVVPIEKLKGAGKHELFVCVTNSKQVERWGSPGKSPLNVVKVVGLQVDADSKPIPNEKKEKWALIVGDSITEGCGTTPLCPYSFLVGHALRSQGYEFCLSACGWSGWLNKGDNPPGDVPGYYVISGSKDGKGGTYHDEKSRWNKIDGNNHSLLDEKGHISAYGGTGQEPALIMINYGTNDILHRSNKSDTCASIAQSLIALRNSAPNASIVILIPFGQYYAKELKAAVDNYKKANPKDSKVHVIDLGPKAANSLKGRKGPFGGLHPNDRGHANFTAEILPRLTRILIDDKQL